MILGINKSSLTVFLKLKVKVTVFCYAYPPVLQTDFKALVATWAPKN